MMLGRTSSTTWKSLSEVATGDSIRDVISFSACSDSQQGREIEGRPLGSQSEDPVLGWLGVMYWDLVVGIVFVEYDVGGRGMEAC